MNEQEERRPNSSPDLPEEQKERDTKSIEGSRRQNRRLLLWVVCAVYLLYLVSSMVKDLRSGGVDSESGRIVVIIACVVFSIVAVVLLAFSARAGIRSFRASVAAMEEEDSASPSAENEPPALEDGETDGDSADSASDKTT